MADLKKTIGTITYELKGLEVVVHEGKPPLNEARLKRMLGRVMRLELCLDREEKRDKCTPEQLEELRREAIKLRAELGLDPNKRLTDPPSDEDETTAGET